MYRTASAGICFYLPNKDAIGFLGPVGDDWGNSGSPDLDTDLFRRFTFLAVEFQAYLAIFQRQDLSHGGLAVGTENLLVTIHSVFLL